MAIVAIIGARYCMPGPIVVGPAMLNGRCRWSTGVPPPQFPGPPIHPGPLHSNGRIPSLVAGDFAPLCPRGFLPPSVLTVSTGILPQSGTSVGPTFATVALTNQYVTQGRTQGGARGGLAPPPSTQTYTGRPTKAVKIELSTKLDC